MKILLESKSKDIIGISRNLDSLKDIPPEMIPKELSESRISGYSFNLLDRKPGNFFYSEKDKGIFCILASNYESRVDEDVWNMLVFMVNKGKTLRVALYSSQDKDKRILKASSNFCRSLIKKLSSCKDFSEMKTLAFRMKRESKSIFKW